MADAIEAKTWKAALEAARGASLAVHSAAGLSLGLGGRDVHRLLRVAEGLVRSAIAVLAVGPRASPVEASAPAPPRRRRPRQRGTQQGVAKGDHGVDKGKAQLEKVEPVAARVPAGSVGGGGGTSRSAARRRRRRPAAEAAAAAANGLPGLSVVSGAQVLELGDSVVVGDLSELFGDVEMDGESETRALAVRSGDGASCSGAAAPAGSGGRAALAVGMRVRVSGGQFLGLEGTVSHFGTSKVCVRPKGMGKRAKPFTVDLDMVVVL